MNKRKEWHPVRYRKDKKKREGWREGFEYKLPTYKDRCFENMRHKIKFFFMQRNNLSKLMIEILMELITICHIT